jgi:hypothetical protein
MNHARYSRHGRKQQGPMARYLFRNAQILDAERGDYLADSSVLVEGDRILEVGGADVQASDAQSFDLAGLTLMAGLIDAHAHVTAVNADTVLCRLNQNTGLYEVTGFPLPRGARGETDKTCNRLSCELVFPDGTRFWGCDIRNVEQPNASLKTPLKPGELENWKLGDFDEITSFAVARWNKGTISPEVASVNAILGRSTQSRYPTLRYLGIASLVSPAELAWLATSPQGPRSNGSKEENDPALVLTYEKASATGSKSTYQQIISRKDLAAALAGKGPELLVGQDPGQARTQQRPMR